MENKSWCGAYLSSYEQRFKKRLALSSSRSGVFLYLRLASSSYR